MKRLRRPNSLFLQGKSAPRCIKPGKLGKLKRKLLKIFKYYTYPGYHHRKADVQRFPKMWYFLGVRLFKGELLAVKVKSNFKEKNSRLGGVKKK